MFPACSADHNCCGVAETFFGCCTCPEEECAFEAAGAGATSDWLAPSGCSAFAGCGVADGDDGRVIRSVENAPAVCGLCLCSNPVGAATETVCTAAGTVARGFVAVGSEIDALGDTGCGTDACGCSTLDCAARFALAVVRAGLPGFVPPAYRKMGIITTAHIPKPTNTPRRNCQRVCARCRSIGTSCMLGTRISCQITGFSVAAPSSACLSRCRRNACQFSPLDAVEVSLSQARICSRAGALNSKKRRPPVRFAESIHANWPVASIAQFRSTDKRSCSKSVISSMGVRLSKHNPSSERFRTEPLFSPPSLHNTIRSGGLRSCNRRFAFIVVQDSPRRRFFREGRVGENGY